MANRLNSDLSGGTVGSRPDMFSRQGNTQLFEATIDNQEKLLITSYERFIKAKEALDKKYNVQKLRDEMNDFRTSEKRRKEIAETLYKLETQLSLKAAEIAKQADINRYKNLSILGKKEYTEQRVREGKALLESLNAEEEIRKAAASSAAEKKKLAEEYATKRKALQEDIDKNEERSRKIEAAYYKSASLKEKVQAKRQQAEKLGEKKKQLKAEMQLELDAAKTPEQKKAVKEKYKDQIQSAAKEEAALKRQANLMEGLAKIGDAMSSALNNSLKEVDQYMSSFYQYQSSINARLQGSTKTYQSITKTLTGNLGLSPYVSQRQYLENLNKLVDAGISYNVEQRAFLMSISDKIATTFDASNGTLLRLIRLQQADTTAARLGMESALTKFLNQMFEDTSYMNSEFYDTVSDAILDTNAILNREQSAEFEYTVQKWLGSLGSLGFSSSAVSSIAQGLNYLGTGNISALASNEGLQTLFAMAFSGVKGTDYVDVLTGGLSASTTNALLKSMVEYLRQIATSGNQVIKSTYANMFNMTMSDFKAIANLTDEDIKNIYNNTLSYNQAIEETTSQLASVGQRMHIGEMIHNVYENAITTAAASVANKPGTYVAWLVNNFIEEATGGINIPFVSALGTGVDLNANINQLAKLGIIGVSTLGQIGTIINSLTGGGGLNLTSWGASDFTTRGRGIDFLSKAPSEGTSLSAFIGSQDAQAAYEETLTSATEKAQETAKITGQDEEDDRLDRIVENTAEMRSKVTNIYDKLLSAAIMSDKSGGSDISVEDVMQKIITGTLDVDVTNTVAVRNAGLFD